MALLLAAILVPFSDIRGQDLGLDEIISRHIQALGGESKLRSVQSLRLTGQYSYRGISYSFAITHARPNLVHLTITVQDRQIAVAYDGASVWEWDGQDPASAQPARDLRVKVFLEAMSDLESPLLNFEEKGHDVELQGVDDLDGQRAYRLKLTFKKGRVEEWHLDADSFLLLRKSMTVSPDEGQFVQAVYFLDYKDVSGFMVPQYIERLDGHRVKGYEITGVEINPAVAADIFKMPNG